MDSYYAPLDHGDVAFPHLWHLSWSALGLFGAWMGRLLGMGPGRKRLADAVAYRHCISALRDDAGEARHDEELECLAHLLHISARHFRHSAHAFRSRQLRSRIRAVVDRYLVLDLPCHRSFRLSFYVYSPTRPSQG